MYVYAQCLEDKKIEEDTLPKELLDKFKSCCEIYVKNNPHTSFDKLCESCSVILEHLLITPDKELLFDRFYKG